MIYPAPIRPPRSVVYNVVYRRSVDVHGLPPDPPDRPRPNVAVSVPHHIVDVIMEIAPVVLVNAYTFAVGHVGIQLVRFTFLEVDEHRDVQDVIGAIVLAYHRDRMSKFLVNIGYFRTFSYSLHIETALVTEQDVIGFVRVLGVGNHEIPRHIIFPCVAVPFNMAVDHVASDRDFRLVVIASVLMECQD